MTIALQVPRTGHGFYVRSKLLCMCVLQASMYAPRSWGSCGGANLNLQTVLGVTLVLLLLHKVLVKDVLVQAHVVGLTRR